MWNFDISKAPRGSYVIKNRKFGSSPADTKVFQPDRLILATKCGKVTTSEYIPRHQRAGGIWVEARLEFLATGEEPVAWQVWPEHPHAEVMS
jgi:hypothetical protein